MSNLKKFLTPEEAKAITDKLWRYYNESDLDVDRSDAVKMACHVVELFILEPDAST